jgi:hypothetical protein
MSCLVVFLLILIVVMAQPTTTSPTPPNQKPSPTDQAGDPKAAAEQGLQALRALVDEQNYRDLGFESQNEAASATLGEPLRVVLVRLDQLREFQPESDPSRLLTRTTEMIYPVLAGGQARCSITLTQEGGKWTAAAFGGAKLIRQITKVRNALVPSANIFVKVPALNVYFIARQEEGAAAGLMLTPLTDQPEYRMKEGVALPAKDAFSALVPAAKAHDGKTS